MVKGITKRVIVVRPHNRKLFEEAIFIVRGDVYTEGGVSSDDLVKEACKIANGHMKSSAAKVGVLRKVPPSVLIILGAACTGLVWLITTMC